MYRSFSLAILAISLFLALTGCRSISPTSVNNQDVLSKKTSIVKTGGALRFPKAISFSDSESLTLNQVILESGGVETTIQNVEVASLEQPKLPVRLEQVSADPVALQTVTDLFQDVENMSKLLAVDRRVSAYDVPIGRNLIELLQVVSSEIKDVLDATPRAKRPITSSEIDATSFDKQTLVKQITLAIGAYQQNNPDFAAQIIRPLEILEGASTTITSTSLVNEPVANRTLKQVTVDSPVMIGLTRKSSGTTHYIHLELVESTTLGEIELRDGDFVFATKVDDTSVAQPYSTNRSFIVPAIGVTNKHNAIESQNHPKIANVISQHRNALITSGAQLTAENVAVFSRKLSGKLTSEIYYLPVSFDASNDNAMAIAGDGQLRPGDSFLFTQASRSPLVAQAIRKKVVDVLEAQSEKNRVDRKPGPRVNKAIKRAKQNAEFYAQPIISGIKSRLR